MFDASRPYIVLTKSSVTNMFAATVTDDYFPTAVATEYAIGVRSL